MKLKEGFMLHKVDNEYMVVATGKAAEQFNGLIRNNKTADFIYQQLLKETTEEEIIEAMLQKYDAPREKITEDVHKIITQMRNAGLLEER